MLQQQRMAGKGALQVVDRYGDVKRVDRDFGSLHIEPREGRVFMMPPVRGEGRPAVAVAVENRSRSRRTLFRWFEGPHERAGWESVDTELETPVWARIVGPDLVVTRVPPAASWPSPLEEPVTVAFPVAEVSEVVLEESDPGATVGLIAGIVLGAGAAFGITVLALAPALGGGAGF